jgi:hypothetical protein
MLLDLLFFDIWDLLFVPLCLLLLFLILRSRANQIKDPYLKRLYFNAFLFRVVCVFAFTLFTEFYFGGGDTNLYYQGVKDLRAALRDNADNLYYIFKTSKIDDANPLAPYFLFDNYANDITINYMRTTANFFIPRLGLIPSLIFGNSYLCISLCFSFFAMAGALRLFKIFYEYYPKLKKELAIAILYLPSVGFWSSGLMKDTLCFGCVGFITYAAYNLLIKKRKIFSSLCWLVLCGYLVYAVKTYIFLVLLLSITIWFFGETNKLIKDKTLRQVFTVMTFLVGIGIGYLLFQYFTSSETLRQYQIDNIVSSAQNQRENYELIDQQLGQSTSYYSINTSNPFLLTTNSIVATFFRPFVWEVKSGAAVLSAIEAFTFLLLTANLFISRRGVKVFRLIFRDPRILMCFMFAIVFSIGVGASTANFGALSRYKIPCMPFYMIMLLLLYNNAGVQYPRWFKWVIGRTDKKNVQTQVQYKV